MQEHRAAAAGDAWASVVIDLDDEIVEMVVALEPVAALFRIQLHGLVVVPVCGIFAPRVVWSDGTEGKKRRRPGMAVGAPPQPHRPEGALGGAAVAFAL